MIKKIDNAAEALEQERDDLRRELMGVQEMLGFVLHTIGQPVIVTKEALQNGLPENTQIAIDEDVETETFKFYLTTEDDNE